MTSQYYIKCWNDAFWSFQAAKSRTTIIIAHRLSTVRHADILFIIDKGVVAEKGNHDQLMEMEGLYWRLVSKQLAGAKTGQGGVFNAQRVNKV